MFLSLQRVNTTYIQCVKMRRALAPFFRLEPSFAAQYPAWLETVRLFLTTLTCVCVCVQMELLFMSRSTNVKQLQQLNVSGH